MSDSESDALPLGYTPITKYIIYLFFKGVKKKMKIRTRFAPSPTGYMHIGNLRTALYCYLIAKKNNGDFILRIEDTDQKRGVSNASQLIYQTLEETGLHYDEGPQMGGPYGPYIQSQRLDIYHHYAQELIRKGGAHYCFCSDEIKEQDPCIHLSDEEIQQKIQNGTPYVIRQTIPQTGITTFDDEVYGHIEVENKTLNEGILIKSDGYPTYNFANVIDDHLMHITHVVRGNEYLSSTPKYNLIYQTLGWDIPTYIHLPTVNKNETHKLSKRDGDASYYDLKNQGFLTEAIMNYIALLGWAPEGCEILSLNELIEQFDIHHISKAPAIFDIEKLKWINGMYLRNMPLQDFHKLLLPHYSFIHQSVNLLEVSRVLQPRLLQVNDAIIQETLDFINQAYPFDIQVYSHKKFKTNPEKSLNALLLVQNHLHEISDFQNDENILQFFINLAKENGMKNGQIMEPVRAALTHKRSSAGGAVELVHIFGKEETLKRLDQAIQNLKDSL